jgi:hypothetical protein
VVLPNAGKVFGLGRHRRQIGAPKAKSFFKGFAPLSFWVLSFKYEEDLRFARLKLRT